MVTFEVQGYYRPAYLTTDSVASTEQKCPDWLFRDTG